MRPRCLRRLRRVPGNVGLVDQDRAERRHDAVYGADHGPDKGGPRKRLHAEIQVSQRPAVHLHCPAQDAEHGRGGDDGLDDEHVPQDGRVDEHDRELDDPEDEERQKVLGRDVGAGGQLVGDVFPPGAEDGAQAYAGDHPAVKSLRGEVDDSDRGSHDDEELGSCDAGGGADVDGEADVVAGGAAGVEHNYYAKDARAYDGCNHGVPPLLIERHIG